MYNLDYLFGLNDSTLLLKITYDIKTGQIVGSPVIHMVACMSGLEKSFQIDKDGLKYN